MMTERKSLGKNVESKNSNKIDLGKKGKIKIGETRDTEVKDINGFLSGNALGGESGGNARKLMRLQR